MPFKVLQLSSSLGLDCLDKKLPIQVKSVKKAFLGVKMWLFYTFKKFFFWEEKQV